MLWSRSAARLLSLRAALAAGGLATALVLAGCGSSGIDGAPTCTDGELTLTGDVGGMTVNLSDKFKGGLKQSMDGELNVTLSKGGLVDLTWSPAVDNGATTEVGGKLAIPGIPGGALCVGPTSELEVESPGSTTFHLTNLTYCETGGAVAGDVYGCISL
ncbi:MAG TPA: hypothetical protein VHB21_00095 [Minicystis sp.]|nr:hypothetical protein [Minicystis sp.]